MIGQDAKPGGHLSNLFTWTGHLDPISTHVVFIHGLDGDIELTWRSTSIPSEVWPPWITADCPHVGTWSVGYDASSSNWLGAGMPLVDRAENVLARLLAEPHLAKGNICFVGHSLGGLLVKQILRSAEREAHSNRLAEEFLHRVKGVAFLATPHFGSDLPKLAKLIGPIYRRSKLTIALERNDTSLRDLNHWYRTFSLRNNFEHLILVESKSAKFGPFRLPGDIGLVVKPDSSDPGVGVTPIPVDADHISISKPFDRQSEIYIHIRKFLSKKFDNTHQNGILAEAIFEQSKVFGELQHSVEEMKLGLNLNSFRSDSRIIDSEASNRFNRIFKSRFFNEFDLKCEIEKLLFNLESGDLQDSSIDLKLQLFTNSARLLSLIDNKKAEELIKKSESFGKTENYIIACAFVFSEVQGLENTLLALSSLDSSRARSASLFVIRNLQGPEAAIIWFDGIGGKLNNIDSDGKFVLLTIFLNNGDWDRALSLIEQLEEEDYRQTPALLQAAGDAHLVQAVPNEYRSIALNQIPFEAATFPLGSDSRCLQHRHKAQDLYNRMSKEALQLGLSQTAGVYSDKALWLALKDPSQFATAMFDLEDSMRDQGKALRRLPLALQFGVKIDRANVESQIEHQTILTGGKSPEAALARFALAFTLTGPEEIATYIDQHRSQLIDHLDPKAIGFIEVDVLAKAGKIQQAERRLAELIGTGITEIEIGRLRRIIHEAVESDPIEMRLALYEQSGSLTDLRNLLTSLEEGEHWSQLREYALSMFKVTHDATDAIRYSKALYESGDFQGVLSFLQEYPEFETQSPNLKIIRCWTLYKYGLMNEARSVLADLRISHDSDNLRMLAVNIALASGDWEALHPFIEDQWTTRNHRTPDELLRVAKLAQLTSSTRTRHLVEKAAEEGANDPNILLGCYRIASESGWEETPEVFGWMQRAFELSGANGPVRLMSLQDLMERKPGWENLSSHALSMLTEGKAPISTVANVLNKSFLNLFLYPALSNYGFSDIRSRVCIPSFSGARASNPMEPKTLTIDVSSLLTLQMLGLISNIITHFDKILVPHFTLPWLFEEKAKLQFHQPSRVTKALELRRLIADGSLKLLEETNSPPPSLSDEVGIGLATLLIEATTAQSTSHSQHLVIHPFPIHKVGSLMQEEVNLSQHENNLSSCMALIDKLIEKGELTEVLATKCKAYLEGNDHPWPNNPIIKDSASIYLDDVSISYLQHLNLLPKFRRAGLTVYIPKSTMAEIDALTAYSKQAERAIALVDELRQGIKLGIDSGKVILGPQQKTENGEIENDPINLQYILRLSLSTEATVIDDRFINQHASIDHDGKLQPIITSLDILTILKSNSVITLEQLYNYRTILRQSGMVFIPLDQEELNYHLSKARVVDGKLLESAELKAIRENLLLTQISDYLQIPQELPWLQTVWWISFNSLKDQWKEPFHEENSIARSNWLLSIMDARKWSHRMQNTPLNAYDRYKNEVAALMMIGSGLPQVNKVKYFEWFEKAILQKIKDESPTFFIDLVEHASKVMDACLENFYSKKSQNDQ